MSLKKNLKKTADEMFEELGYKKKYENTYEIKYEYKKTELDLLNEGWKIEIKENYVHKQVIKDEIKLHTNYLINQAVTSNPTLDAHFRDKEKYVIQSYKKLLDRIEEVI